MKITELVEALVASKATPETILAAVRVAEAQRDAEIEASKQKARDRMQRYKENHPKNNVSKRSATSTNVSERLTGEGARVEDKTSNSEIEPQETNKRAREPSGFERWYATYPHKVQRGAAERAFPKALSLAGSVEALVAGVQRYVASKPPDRQWQNPATWLNGKGWLDTPGTVVPMARAGPRRNPLMDRLDEMTRPPNDDDPATSQALVLHVSASGFEGR